jgi:hypothetical protein
MMRADALVLANECDAAWHDQPRSFEREALTRFWGLLTLPARVLDPHRPREMLRAATVLRNGRFKGEPVRGMFFANKDFTEIDGLFLQVGSSLGHPSGEDAWVVEVERKAAHQQGDYYVAIQRARKFADFISHHFKVRARPVVIFEDDGGKYSYQPFEGEVLLIPMGALRGRTQGLSFPSLVDLPGVASDRTLVKLALLRQLVSHDPNHPGWFGGPLALARASQLDGIPLHMPAVGHQDAGAFPGSIARWIGAEREDDTHLGERIDRYLDQLHRCGVIDRRRPAPRLSTEGGQIVLRLLQGERGDPA